jgi:hypothetical protein
VEESSCFGARQTTTIPRRARDDELRRNASRRSGRGRGLPLVPDEGDLRREACEEGEFFSVSAPARAVLGLLPLRRATPSRPDPPHYMRGKPRP